MNKRKSLFFSGFFWSVIEKFSLQGINLTVTIILARLLEPEQFGIIGMLTIFMSLAQFLIDSGFSSALIQKKETNQNDYCSTFFLNITIGFILGGTLAISAGMIANFFEEPQLIPLTRFMALNIVFSSFGLVHSAILTKEMKFRALFQISLISSLVSGVIGVLLAYKGLGVWSLAVHTVINTLLHTIFYWFFNPWRPQARIDSNSIRSLSSFGSKILVSDIISTIFRNLYQTIIGKVYSAKELGYYSRSHSMVDALLTVTSGSLSRVISPTFSPIQDDIEKLKTGYRKISQLYSFIHFPLMIGLAAAAKPLILFLMTDKWSESIPMFQLFCFINLLYPNHLLNLNILKVRGRSDLYLQISWLKIIFQLFVLLLTYRLGIMVMLIGLAVSSIIHLIINGYYSKQMINYPVFEQVKDFIPSLSNSLIMGALMTLILTADIKSNFLILILQSSAGLVTYYLLNRIENSYELSEAKNLAMNIINKIKEPK